MFLDEVSITVRGGSGGRGCVSWRREKYVPKGGPDGGDGGNGGNFFLVADPNTDTLSDFSSKKVFEAKSGRFGTGKNCGGKNGEDFVLHVPPGTMVYEKEIPSPGGIPLPLGGDKGEGVRVGNIHTNLIPPLLNPPPSGEVLRLEGRLLADLHSPRDQVLVAKGGRGGYGNAHFVSSVRQRPDFAELGEPGEEKELKLELKLVADVGIIGFPNVGKSTLISVISAARPKIADYPFTTLVPNLGVVTLRRAQGDIRSYVVCDIPGLIEGAAEGKGLGHEFLRHIERCGILLHILDTSRPDIVDDYKKLRSELEKYSPTLAQKKELVVLNKIDLIQIPSSVSLDTTSPSSVIPSDFSKKNRIDGLEGLATRDDTKKLQKAGINIFASISATTHQGTDDLAKRLLPLVLEERNVMVPAGRSLPSRLDRAEADGEGWSPTNVMVSSTNHDTSIPILRPHLDSDDMRSYDIQYDGTKLIVRGKRIEQFTQMTDFGSPGAVLRFRDVLKRIGLLNLLKGHTGEIFIGNVQVNEYL